VCLHLRATAFSVKLIDQIMQYIVYCIKSGLMGVTYIHIRVL